MDALKAFASLVIAMLVAGICATVFAGVLIMILARVLPDPNVLTTFVPAVLLASFVQLYLVWRFYGIVRRWFGGVA